MNNNKDKKIIGYDENTGFPIYDDINSQNEIYEKKELTVEDNEEFSKNMMTSIITLAIGIIIHIFLIIGSIKTSKMDTSSAEAMGDPFFRFLAEYCISGLIVDLITLPFAWISIKCSNGCLKVDKNILSRFIIVLNILLFLPLLIFLISLIPY